MNKIGIVIINYNSDKETAACLLSLEEITVPKDTAVQVYLVDNGSKNESTESVRKMSNSLKRFRCEFITSSINKGFSGGNNLGITKGLKDSVSHIMLLNNDTFVKKDFLIELLRAFGEDNHVGAVCPKIYFAKGYEFHKDRYKTAELGKVFWYAGGSIDWKNVIGNHIGVDEVDSGQYDAAEEIEFATGCCILIKRAALERVGLLNESYFLYYEDAEYSIRMKRAGYTLMYMPTAVIWHKNAGSSGGSGSALQDYFMTRNRLLFGMEYAPFRTKAALLRESMKLIRTGREWQRIGVRDYFSHTLGMGSYHS